MSYAPSSGVAASQPDALNTSNVSHGSGGLQASQLSTTGGHLTANTQGALVGPFPSMAASQSMTRESSYRVNSPTSAGAQMQQSQNGIDAAASSLTNAHLQQMSQPALSVQPPSQQYSASGASQHQANHLHASQLQASQLSASGGSQLQQQLSQAVSQAQASVSQQPSQMQNSHAATSQHPSQLQSQQPSQFVSQQQPSQFLSQSQQPSQQASQQPSQFLSQQQQQQQQSSQSQLLSQQMSQQPSQQQQISQASHLSQHISQQPSQQISQQISQQPSQQQQQLSQQQQQQQQSLTPQNPASAMQKFLSVSFAPAQSQQSAAAAASAQQASDRAASPSPSSGTGQGLQALLQVIEGTGAQGLVGVQVHTQCDALFAAVTSLLRVAGEQDASITALRGELQASRGEEQALRERMSGLESRLQTMAADAAAHTEAQTQLQTRVQMAEGKCEEATTAAGRVPALQSAQQQLLARVEELASQLGAVEGRFAEREQQLALVPSSPRPDAEQLTQPLREAIQEMVVTCQNLAAKQTDTVHVVQQLFQRVESLEEAMSSVQDVVSKLCATTNQQGLKDLLKLFELPEHLQPYLGNTESRLHILHTRPVFQTLFDQLRLLNEKCDAALATGSPRTLSTAAPLAVAAATDSQFAHLAPNSNAAAAFEGRSLQFDDAAAAAAAEAARAAEEAAAAAALAAEEAAVANATLFGAGHQGLMDRSALEAADKLVAQLTQTMGEQRETGRGGGSGGVAAAAAAAIGGRQSPRAREFHAVSPRNNTSPLKIKPPSAAAAAAASFSNSVGSPVSGSPGSTDGPEAALLGIEVADGDSCVTVAKIYPNSPSSVGGIRKGDRIISFNGTNVATRADFLRALARTRPAQLVPIIFVPQTATTPVATHLVIGGLSSSAQ